MRKILFRGKRESDGEWVYGDFRNTNGMSSHNAFIVTYTNEQYNEVIPETVGQFTGLFDKNDKMIFEGDIVGNDYNRDIETVRWRDDSCGFEPYSDSLENCGHCGGGLIPWRSEVIGNIHDNPELLEVKS